MSNLTPKMEIAKDVLINLLNQVDARIYTPEELADRAFLFADALEKRFERENNAMIAAVASGPLTVKPSMASITAEMLDKLNRTTARQGLKR